ncbi:MAG: hypothetical protein JWO05_1624 [Gemmatimonadetes bacterium]|nr:hypothetical protein [Gemmatimonadota bacterium]
MPEVAAAAGLERVGERDELASGRVEGSSRVMTMGWRGWLLVAVAVALAAFPQSAPSRVVQKLPVALARVVGRLSGRIVGRTTGRIGERVRVRVVRP